MDGSLSSASRSNPPGHGYSQTIAAVESGEDGVHLRELFRQIWRRKSVIFSTIVVFTGLATLVVFQITPLYTASSAVVIESRENNVVNIEDVLSGLSGDSSVIESEIEIITSTSVLEAVARKLRLVQDPEFNAELREPGLMAQLDPLSLIPESWLVAIGAAGDDKPPLTPEEELARQRAAVVGGLGGRVSVASIGRSRAIRISVTSEDPRKAAQIANTLADTYLDQQLEAKYQATKRATEWLNTRVSELRQQVEASERAVEKFRNRAGLTRGADARVSDQQISEINSELILARTKRAEADARLEQVQSLVRSGGVESAAEVLSSDLIQNLREQEAEVQRRMAELSTEYGDRHPRMINIRAELSDLQEKIGAEVRKIVQNLENEVEVARARERTLEQNLTQLEARAADLNQSEVQLRQLEREAEANRALYQTFLSRLKETTNQQGIQTPDARIISEADAPGGPSYPNKKMVVTGSLVFSALIGLGFAFLLEQLDSGFRSLQQIESHTRVPGLALVPLLAPMQRRKSTPPDYMVDRPASAYGESIRSLHTSILLSNVDQPPKTVLITSSQPNEGKTTIAISLARSVAKSGKKVLLIDADLRHPAGHNVLGLTNEYGLVDVLADGSDLERSLQRDGKTGLWFLAAGKSAPNPPELLASDRLRRLLSAASSAYDLVVVDTAPVLAVSDARILARDVDKAVYVVRWSETRREVVAMGLKQVREAGGDLAGVALSMVNVRRHAQYGYGDSGYYYGPSRKYYTH